MRILLSVGNAPGAPTGYGSQALLLLRAALADAANSVTVLAWNFNTSARGSLQQAQTPWSTREFFDQPFVKPLMARVFDALDASERTEWLARVQWMGNWCPRYPAQVRRADFNAAIVAAQADVLIVLQDIFFFEPGPFACPAIAWMPLHFLPIEKSTLRVLADFDVLVAISGYGAEMLRCAFGFHHGAAAGKHVEVIPHGRPACGPGAHFVPLVGALDPSDAGVARTRAARIELRQRLGWPTFSKRAGSPSVPVPFAQWADAPGGDGAVHITLLVASNSEESGRKAFDAQIAAWGAFADARERAGFPRDATLLIIHAELSKAYDLGRLLETLGELPSRAFYEVLEDRRGVTSETRNALGLADDARIQKQKDAEEARAEAKANKNKNKNKNKDKETETHNQGVLARALAHHAATMQMQSSESGGGQESKPLQGGIRGERVWIVPSASLGSTTDARMADMQRACDVLLAATTSEGCGVPILEAQLCGVPVVTNATTAMPEQTVLGVSARAGQYIARMDFCSGWLLPDVQNVACALATVAQWSDAERARRARKAMPTLRARYDARVVVDAWRDLLHRVKRDIVDRVRVFNNTSVHAVGAPWLTRPFDAWLANAAQTLRVALTPRRLLALQASRAAADAEAERADALTELKKARALHTSLASRLVFVRAARSDIAQSKHLLTRTH